MEAMGILRKLTKPEYASLREKVRSNILINSEVVESKRRIFYGNGSFAKSGKKVIVGGIVLKKHVFHRGSLYKEDEGLETISLNQVIENPSLVASVENISTRATLVLFDFSGVFTVDFEPSPMGFLSIKEGEIVYAIGNVSPINIGKGAYIYGSHLLTENAMASYKKGEHVYCREDIYNKDDIKKIKETNIDEDLMFLVENGGSSMDITNRLLKEISRTEGADYFWIISVVYDSYRKEPSEKMYNLIEKYFYKWSETQNGMETKAKKEEWLESWFPR